MNEHMRFTLALDAAQLAWLTVALTKHEFDPTEPTKELVKTDAILATVEVVL